jgi:hypothetical protein
MELGLGPFAAPAEMIRLIWYGANNLYPPEIGPQFPLHVVGKDPEGYVSRLFKLVWERAFDAIGSC